MMSDHDTTVMDTSSRKSMAQAHATVITNHIIIMEDDKEDDMMNMLSYQARDGLECLDALDDLDQKFYTKHQTRNTNDETLTMDRETLMLQRRKLVQWCHRVVTHFDLPSYLVEWTMNLSDRFFANSQCRRTSNTWKTMTGAALYFVVKLHRGQGEIQDDEDCKKKYHRFLVGDQVVVSRDAHEAAMFVIRGLVLSGSGNTEAANSSTAPENNQFMNQLEMVLLRGLHFHVHPPLLENYLDEMITKILPLSGTTDMMDDEWRMSLLKTKANEYATATVFDMFDEGKISKRDIAQACLLNALEDLSLSIGTTTATTNTSTTTSSVTYTVDDNCSSSNSSSMTHLCGFVRQLFRSNYDDDVRLSELQERIRHLYTLVYGYDSLQDSNHSTASSSSSNGESSDIRKEGYPHLDSRNDVNDSPMVNDNDDSIMFQSRMSPTSTMHFAE